MQILRAPSPQVKDNHDNIHDFNLLYIKYSMASPLLYFL